MAYVPVIGASSSLGRLQRDEAHKECAKLLKSEIERGVREAHPLLEVADGKTLEEVLTPILPAARLALMLLAVAEGRTNAVMLHGLWGSARSNRPLARRLSALSTRTAAT